MVGILEGSARGAAAADGRRQAAEPYFTTAHCYHPGIPVSHATPDVELAEAQMAPDGLLVDYHLDDGNGIAAIAELRCRFGSDLPAILITADRSPHVRADARAQGIQLLHKPLKPAALRALLTQWRMQRLAAAE